MGKYDLDDGSITLEKNHFVWNSILAVCSLKAFSDIILHETECISKLNMKNYPKLSIKFLTAIIGVHFNAYLSSDQLSQDDTEPFSLNVLNDTV